MSLHATQFAYTLYDIKHNSSSSTQPQAAGEQNGGCNVSGNAQHGSNPNQTSSSLVWNSSITQVPTYRSATPRF